MADPRRRLPTNVEGEFFVDESCIDCDACRWIAPKTFDEAEGHSRVHRQPGTPEESFRAELALVACPTSSIGTTSHRNVSAAAHAFPVPIDANVHHCGYHAESSFGAASWLLVRPDGNVLVDSPRFAAPLVKRLEELGGVKRLFLTHRDDVADHAKFADHFGCERILHEADLDEDTRAVEHVVRGLEPVALADDLLVIPTPGHTVGSACLLQGETHLFGGDHIAFSPELGHPYGFRSACWYSWPELVGSMERLARFRFEWILPGHGRLCHFPKEEMARQMRRCVEWARGVRSAA
jgi:glyoxylase-like metal-dependent hydrolase (beta-lactamase superfamily II)/ferredoxin